jgi:hypothetical protein
MFPSDSAKVTTNYLIPNGDQEPRSGEPAKTTARAIGEKVVLTAIPVSLIRLSEAAKGIEPVSIMFFQRRHALL